MEFFFEVLIGGLLSGVMYALVALGFVLIYKASGVFNFAQGAMVYLAALSVAGCMEKGAPLWLAVILAFVIMTLFGIATERFVLRKLVNQPPIALFKGMSVLDNIMTGRTLKMKSNMLLQALWLGPAQKEEIEHRRKVEEIIDFLEIQHIRKTPVGRLPYGLQKRVDLGRALAMEPQILLLDEPMAGMNVEEKQDMCRFILDVNDQFGTTIVLIEHDMGVVMDISDRVVVLDYGKKIGDGLPDEVRASPEVIKAYLGAGH